MTYHADRRPNHAPIYTGFHERLGPGVIQALRDAFLAAQLGNAV